MKNFVKVLLALFPFGLFGQTVNVNKNLNNANIDSVSYFLISGTDTFKYVQENPVPGVVSPGGNIGVTSIPYTGVTPVVINQVTIDGGVGLPFANKLGIRIANINPKLGTAPPVTSGNYQVVQSNAVAASGLRITNSTNNLANFETSLIELFGSLDVRSKINVAGSISGSFSGESDFDAQLSYSGLPDQDFLFVAERNGNSIFEAQALDAAGNIIGNKVCFGCGAATADAYDWNSGIAFAGSNEPQSMVFSVTPISTFFQNDPASAEPVFGFRFALAAGGGPDINFFLISSDPFENNPINPNFAGIRGRVFNDVANNNTGNGISAPSGVPLFVNMLNASNVVIQSVPLDANGDFGITAITNGTYTLQLSTIQGVAGALAPAVILPSGWVNTVDFNETTSVGTPNGIISSVVVANDEVTEQINFGIQKAPESGFTSGNTIVTVPSSGINRLIANPFNLGSFGGTSVPSAAFGGTDDGSGEIDELRITALSANIESITVDGTEYTNGSLPVGGVVVPTNVTGQPTVSISLKTVSGYVDSEFPSAGPESGDLIVTYATIDNAGAQSLSTTNLEIPVVALKFQAGEWHNGSTENGEPLGSSATAANMPDEDDGDKTLFWIDNDGALTKSAVVRNLQIFAGVTATVDNGACITVLEEAIGEDADAKLALKAQSDLVFAQYLGPQVKAAFEMIKEEGFHNIGFPVDITVAEWADQNNDAIDYPFVVNLTNDPETHNLTWYDSHTSGGIQQGFFINRGDFEDTDNMLYSANAYGTWNLSEGTENAIERGYNYAINPFMAPLVGGNYTLVAEGPTNDAPQTYSTSDNFGGWNLIPNIYPVTISTSAMFADGFFNDFDNAVWIWDPRDNYDAPISGRFSTGAYRAYDVENDVALAAGNSQLTNSAANIAPFQAFYVRRTTGSLERRDNVGGGALNAPGDAVTAGSTTDNATDVTGSLIDVTMKPAYRTSCLIKEHFKTQTQADILLLQAKEQTSGAYDILELAFADHYTNGIDVGLDIAKQGVASGTQPLIFTSINNTALVINKMNWPNEGTSVPMGFYAKEDGLMYEIAMIKHPGVYTVYLEDLKTGNWTDLTRQSYSFANDVKNNLHRFRIHFKLGSASIDDFHPGIRAWSMSEGIKVQFHNLITDNARIRITDAVGRVLFDGSNITTREDFMYPTAQLSKGLYTVTVITAENTITEKIIH